MRPLDVLNVNAPSAPEPTMPVACQSGGCGGGPDHHAEAVEVGGEVLVGGEPIDPDAIAREMQNHPAATIDEAWLSAARALAVRSLLICELGDRKADERAIQGLLEREVVPRAPDERECRRVYDASPGRFSSPELIEAAHILIEPTEDTPGAWHRAKLLAEKLIGEIGEDAAAFTRAARKYSGCPSARQDGSLGQVRKGDLAWPVERALLALQDGEISSIPIQSTHGWHILRVHRRIAGRQLPYDVVKPQIRDMLEARSWTMAAAHYVGVLAQKHGVEGIDLEGTAA